MIKDQKDFNIRWINHPKYKVDRIIEDDLVEVIIQKLEMVLFTRKGELFGDSNFGCNLEYYLWSTSIPSDNLEKIIKDQIYQYIPELNTIGYDLKIDMYKTTGQDSMILNFNIKGYNVEFLF